MKTPPPIVGSILKVAKPIVEERISELKEEATEELDKVHVKLDKIIKLLEK